MTSLQLVESAPKLLVSVGSGGFDPWLAIETEGQAETFGKNVPNNAQLTWVQADPRLDGRLIYRFLSLMASRTIELRGRERPQTFAAKLQCFLLSSMTNFIVRKKLADQPIRLASRLGRRVTLPHPSHYSLGASRTFLQLRHALEHSDFDFLLRTTSTSYVDIAALLEELRSLEPVAKYCGTVYKKHGISFIGGASILMSRDVVEALARDSKQWRFDLFDDIAIGRVIGGAKIAIPQSWPRVDVRDLDGQSIRKRDLASPVPLIYRCKVEHPWTYKAGPVVDMMKEVHTSLSGD